MGVQVELPVDRADLVLMVDGGSRGNPGFGYGSYRISDRTGHGETVRLTFGDRVTNNEAEYRTLIAALEAALAHAGAHGWPPRQLTLAIVTDSQLVTHQVSGHWRVREARLRPLYERVQQLLRQFARAHIVWRPRSEIVRVLGH